MNSIIPVVLCSSADKMVKVEPTRVTVAGKDTFGCVNMDDFLKALAGKLKPNPTASC